MNYDFGRVCNEVMALDCGILGCDTVVTASFKVLSQDLPEGTEETMKSLVLGTSFLLVCGACTHVVQIWYST
jgi:hypothetical protein